MKLNNETKVGMLVLVSLAVLIGITVKAGNFNLKKDGCHVNVIFDDIDGIKLNSPVMFNGLEVGLVDNISVMEDLEKTHMVLTLWVSHQVRLHQGTKALIKNLGFMGEKYVALIGEDARTPILKDGAFIQGQSPVGFDQILASGQRLLGTLNGVADNVDERLKKNQNNIDAIFTNLNEMSYDLKSHPWKLLFKGGK